MSGAAGNNNEKEGGSNNNNANQNNPMPTLNSALDQTGEAGRLKEYIQQRLVQSGWRDDLKNYAVDYIRKRGALDKSISVDEIVSEIAPRGRQTVPDSLRQEVLERVREFARSQGIH